MRSGKLITLSVWLMILFNILLSFGAVWSLQRLPEIKSVYERNVESLDACEKMLLQLAGEKVDFQQFRAALDEADKNITEIGESESIQKIRTQLDALQAGDPRARSLLVPALVELSKFNKKAIEDTAKQTQRLRQTGMWGLVFLTMIFFVAALFFEQRLRRSLLSPLQEISSVIEADAKGDRFRRCSLHHASSEDMRKLFQAINNLLDRRK